MAIVWMRAIGLPLPIAATCGLENTQGKGKIKIYMCAWRPIVSDPKRRGRKNATLPSIMVKGDCVLDFCLEWDLYDSGYCKTIEVFSVLINGGPGWLCHKRTYK